MSKKVSIIIPVYNIEENLLRRCVMSVVNQDYDNLEVILVDDGSDDETKNTCNKLKDEDTTGRIRLFRKENGGSSSARNLGISKATGDFIGFVDSDDYVDNDFVSLMMDAEARFRCPMIQISRDEIDTDGLRRPDVCIPPDREELITNEEAVRELLMHRGDASFCTRLCRRELFSTRAFPEGRLNEDFALLLDMLNEVDSFVILPRQAYHVYYRLNSNTRKRDKSEFSRVYVDIVDNADMAEALVERKYPSLKVVAKRFALFQRLDYLLHIPVEQMKKDNHFYVNVVRYLRQNVRATMTNPYLTNKNRVYLMLLTVAPRTVRGLHRMLMRLRGVN